MFHIEVWSEQVLQPFDLSVNCHIRGYEVSGICVRGLCIRYFDGWEIPEEKEKNDVPRIRHVPFENTPSVCNFMRCFQLIRDLLPCCKRFECKLFKFNVGNKLPCLNIPHLNEAYLNKAHLRNTYYIQTTTIKFNINYGVNKYNLLLT